MATSGPRRSAAAAMETRLSSSNTSAPLEAIAARIAVASPQMCRETGNRVSAFSRAISRFSSGKAAAG